MAETIGFGRQMLGRRPIGGRSIDGRSIDRQAIDSQASDSQAMASHPSSGAETGTPGAGGVGGFAPLANRGSAGVMRGGLAMIAAAQDLGAAAGCSAFTLGAAPALYVQPPAQPEPGATPLAAWPAHCGPDLRRRMSDHIAYALLAYTALQIFVTMSVLRAGVAPLLPFVALIVLVAAIIPACRRYELRWSGLGPADMADPALPARFRRDLTLLWAIAAGLPFVITGLFVAIGNLAG